MPPGLSGAIESFRKERNALVKKKQDAWNKFLQKYAVTSPAAQWLLENPIPTNIVHCDAWMGHEKEKKSQPYVKNCQTFLNAHFFDEFEDEELLMLWEAFPFPFILEMTLEKRQLPPSLLLQYKIVERYKNVFDIQPHLKKLTLEEQIPFMDKENRCLLVVRAIVDYQKQEEENPQKLYFSILQKIKGRRIPEFDSFDTEDVVNELNNYGYSFKKFGADDFLITQLLDLLKVRNANFKIILELLLSSKKHSSLVQEILDFVKIKDDEMIRKIRESDCWG